MSADFIQASHLAAIDFTRWGSVTQLDVMFIDGIKSKR